MNRRIKQSMLAKKKKERKSLISSKAMELSNHSMVLLFSWYGLNIEKHLHFFFKYILVLQMHFKLSNVQK